MTRIFAPLILLPLAACSMAPNVARPSMSLPAQFAEAPGWRPANPSDAGPKGDWWLAFDDPVLTVLEGRVAKANQTIAQAVAAYDQARATVGESRSNLLPSISTNDSATHSATFAGGATTQSASSGQIISGTNRYSAGVTAAWQIDLFGALREGLKQSKLNTAAAAGDLGNAILTAQGELALNYIQLRQTDAERDAQAMTAQAYAKALTITENRYAQGVVARLDVVQAESQLHAAQAQLAEYDRQRDVLVHAIAVLVGENASLFTLTPKAWAPVVPQVPAVLPASVLERRPDVAAAERRVEAANQGVGIARSAFFPTISLSAGSSTSGNALSQLFQSSTSLWSLGVSLADTLFDFGGRSAKVREARAGYQGTVAKYKATVLTAFQQTEDALAAQRQYAREEDERRAASTAADRAESITFNQYKAGIVGYANVITTQTTALANRQSLIIATSNRQQATVSLIQAIGGGWVTD